MKAPSEIRTVEDVLQWVKDAMEVTPFGIIGITVTMHEGRPKYASPRWEPNVMLGEEKSPSASSGRIKLSERQKK